MPVTERHALLGTSRWIRLYWLDYAGILRVRIIPASRFKSRSIKLTRRAVWVGAQDDCCDASPMEQEDLLEPDLTSLRAMPYIDAPTASSFGFFIPKNIHYSDQEVSTCPRTILSLKLLSSALREHGLHFLVGFELEFVLLDSIDPLRPAGPIGWSCASSVRPGSKALAVLEESCTALETMGYVVPLIHAESAPGQLEIPLGPLPPLESVDACIIARETITNIAYAKGLRATFAPSTVEGACGTALHFHISMQPREGASLPEDEPLSTEPFGLSKRERHFLAGLIKHLPALIGITLPSDASYARVKDNAHTGGTYSCFGVEHREAPLRLCEDFADDGTRIFHIEFKQSDATSNPYVSIAAVIHAGLLGIEDELPLSRPTHGVAANMSQEERESFEITTQLPLTLPDALDRLRRETKLVDRIGREAINVHLAVRENEHRIWEQMPEAAQRRMIVTAY